MKLIKTLTALAAGGCCCAAINSQASLVLDMASFGTIQFNGVADTFQFNSAPVTGETFFINNESGSQATGSAFGLFGGLSHGPFSYGPTITTGAGGSQSATVNGPLGSFFINDGLGVLPSDLLTGNVNWMQVTTSTGNGNPAGLNAELTVNISGVNYTGGNADLQTIASGAALNDGSMDLSFSFSPAETLTQLSSGPVVATSFSGQLSVPEPTTMLAGAMLLLPFGASTLRVLRRKISA